MESVVELSEVSKGYRMYSRPTDRLWEIFTGAPRHTRHWALSHVSLRIESGETFGVIGENGAGKSTMLKLVAGTSRTTDGTVAVEGRVAALLELGTGFHPAETGRQNAYLLGALNGVASRDMDRYFRDVAAFSELSDDVLDHPVKTYSTGMFMRLAFSVATHVDPDVLVIDEALAVGDMHFQKKSLDRIMGFREAGKTVVFCSHNLYQIRTLCSRTVWLHQGGVMAIGETEEVVARYEAYEQEKSLAENPENVPAPTPAESMAEADPPVRISKIELLGADGLPRTQFDSFQDMSIRVGLKARDRATRYHVAIVIYRSDRERVFGTGTNLHLDIPVLSGDRIEPVVLSIPRLPILSGDYLVSVFVLDETGLHAFDMAEYVHPFTVRNPGREMGNVYIPHEWQV